MTPSIDLYDAEPGDLSAQTAAAFEKIARSALASNVQEKADDKANS